jgi:hypothetical protein
MDEFAEGRNWRCLLEIPDFWLSGIKDPAHNIPPGGGHLFIIFREFLRRSIEASGVLADYDWLLLTRSDMMYPLPHPSLDLLSPDFIWLPDGERYNGFTERYNLIPRRYFAQFLGMMRDIFERPEDLARRMKPLDKIWNDEMYIKFRLGEMGLLKRVRFIPYYMYLVRAPSGHTRWSAGDYNAQLRFFIKYRKEYTSSLALQGIISEDDDWRYVIGWRRFFNWRMYAYALMRTGAERYELPRRFRFLRMVKRFATLMLQPIETGRLDRIR